MDKNLRAFLTVVETGSLQAAADKIGLTQPSITKRLHNMEAEIGGALFDRRGREMKLTSVGRQFHQRAKRIEQEYLQAHEEMRNSIGAGLDVLRVGAGPLFHLRYLPSLFVQLHREYPLVQYELHADINERTIPMLLSGQLDIVLGVLDQPADEMGLLSLPITDVEQAVILSSQSKLATQESLSSDDIRSLSWILYGGDQTIEQWLTHYFSEHNIGSPKIVLRTGAFSTGLQMVTDGDFAMMAPLQLEPVIHAAGMQLLPVTPPLSKRSAGAYVRPSSMGFGVVSRFVALLEQECHLQGVKL